MRETVLYNKERMEQILQIVKESGSVSVNELASRFRVSGATIRSDLTKLENSGAVTRTHGGVMLSSGLLRESKPTDRLHDAQKRAVAERALDYIQNGDVILLDTGTTMVSLARAIARSRIEELTVFTNDLDVARILEGKERFTLCLLGGRVRNGFHYCYSPEMLLELSGCHFHKLFLATSAIHLEHGLTTENPDLAQIKQGMIRASGQVILLTDATKFDQIHLKKFADLADLSVVIVDKALPSATEEALRRTVGEVILV